MIFVRLTAENFGPFKEIDYDFLDRPILIQGQNLTDDSQESNGSGKSYIQAAIEYCLFKTTSFKCTDGELVRIGEDSAKVGLEIYCPIRQELMIINRTISLKDSGKLSISINPKPEPESFATVNDGNKLILNWIGISAEDLQNYYIINKERYTSIFSSSNREKIEMINRFSNAKLIDGVDKKVEEDVRALNGELKSYTDLKTSLESRILTLEEQIQSELSRDFEQEQKDEIDLLERSKDDITEKIDGAYAMIDAIDEANPMIESVITTERKVLMDKKSVISDIEASLQGLERKSFDSDYALIDKKKDELEDVKYGWKTEKARIGKQVKDVEEILTEINHNIQGSVKCPKCSHEFLVGNPDVNIQAEKESKIETEAILKSMTSSLISINTKLDELDKLEESIESDEKEVKAKESKVHEEKRKLRNSIGAIENEVIDLGKRIAKLETSLTDNNNKKDNFLKLIENYKADIARTEELIKSSKLKSVDTKRIDEWKTQIKAEAKKLQDIEHSIKRKEEEIFNVSQWIVNFSKFNMYLANQSLKVIQGYCNKFLKDVKSDIQIKWEGVKILADGKRKEEITPYVIRNGVTRKYGNFSGGERARMDYSMIMALQTMINKTHKYGGLDFLSTDEIAEGLDGRGLSDLMKSLQNFNKTILITTHVVNVNVSDKVLLVRKEKGISTIVKN